MNKHTPTSPIPDDAIEVITETWETGNKQRAVYLVNDKEIAYRYWYESGVIGIEFGLQNGMKHGPYRIWDEDGQIEEESAYYEGKEHGETIQYWNGVRIGSYIMDHGTGLDLWFNSPGVLAEEREFLNGSRHGYERWWHGDNQTIFEESHFWNGIEHGIFRRWNR
jgi:antitoxin component YwqK of YwqJK toxin-antitoxin module